ncbi:MAG: hypothetical protein IJ188_05865 [Clostridia bacterium]|nr:hypothetical protein [Clostridia bacterium]MBQ9252142.1 hypothetical protein [Clostridia bacterium]
MLYLRIQHLQVMLIYRLNQQKLSGIPGINDAFPAMDSEIAFDKHSPDLLAISDCKQDFELLSMFVPSYHIGWQKGKDCTPTKIWTEWLPSLRDYELAGNYSLEAYAEPAEKPEDTVSYIGVPLKKKALASWPS